MCSSKTFYDADLNYCDARYDEKYGYLPDRLGAWVVLCEDCATRYDIEIVRKPIEMKGQLGQ